MKCKMFGALFAFAPSISAFGAPQLPPGHHISFSDFIQNVENNADSVLEQASLKASEVEVNRVGTFPDPFVQMGRERQEIVFLNPMDGVKPQAPAWTLGLSQEFPWPGVLQGQKKSRMAGVHLLQAQIELARLLRKQDAAEYYLDLIKSKQTMGIKKTSLSELERVLAIQNARHKEGLGSHSELISMQTEVELLKSELGALENELLTKQARAILLTGRSLQTSASFDDSFPAELLVEKKPPNEKALPALDSLNRIEELQLGKKLAALDADRLGTLPSLTTSLTLMRDDSKMFMYNAMIGFRIPVFSGSVRSTLSDVLERNQQISRGIRSWNLQRKELAFLQWERRSSQARANLKVLDERLVPLNTEHVNVLLSEFSQGRSSFVELNQARRTLLKLQESRVGMRYALALEGVRYEKIVSGAGDDTIDAPMPRLSSAGMDEASAMFVQVGMGTANMKSALKKDKNSDVSTDKKRVNASPEQEDSGGQLSGSGMGM